MVYTLASGASARKGVEVQLLSWALPPRSSPSRRPPRPDRPPRDRTTPAPTHPPPHHPHPPFPPTLTPATRSRPTAIVRPRPAPAGRGRGEGPPPQLVATPLTRRADPPTSPAERRKRERGWGGGRRGSGEPAQRACSQRLRCLATAGTWGNGRPRAHAPPSSGTRLASRTGGRAAPAARTPTTARPDRSARWSDVTPNT